MKLLRNYILWTYDRGSIHYDVMVTLILVFIFLSPRFIDFHDRPVPNLPQHADQVLITEAGPQQFLYQVRADSLTGDTSTDANLRASLLSVIQPIAGPVQITQYQPVKDAHGSIVAYSVHVQR